MMMMMMMMMMVKMIFKHVLVTNINTYYSTITVNNDSFYLRDDQVGWLRLRMYFCKSIDKFLCGGSVYIYICIYTHDMLFLTQIVYSYDDDDDDDVFKHVLVTNTQCILLYNYCK